jgi:hypothetical protein
MARSSSDSFWNRTRQAIEIRFREKNATLITKKNSIAICLTRALSLDAFATAMRTLATWRARGAWPSRGRAKQPSTETRIAQ